VIAAMLASSAAGFFGLLGVVVVQLRMNAESKRKYALGRHVFDQTRKVDIMSDVTELTRADRPPMAIGWKPTQQIGGEGGDSSDTS
jgi:hypothetical protein